MEKKGKNSSFGYRPLKRMISHDIEYLIAEYIVSGKLTSEDKLIIKLKDNNLTAEIMTRCVN